MSLNSAAQIAHNSFHFGPLCVSKVQLFRDAAPPFDVAQNQDRLGPPREVILCYLWSHWRNTRGGVILLERLCKLAHVRGREGTGRREPLTWPLKQSRQVVLGRNLFGHSLVWEKKWFSQRKYEGDGWRENIQPVWPTVKLGTYSFKKTQNCHWKGLLWWSSGYESAWQCRGHQFNPWSRRNCVLQGS